MAAATDSPATPIARGSAKAQYAPVMIDEGFSCFLVSYNCKFNIPHIGRNTLTTISTC